MRSAIQPDAILYMKFRRIIGRQKKTQTKIKKQNKTKQKQTNKQCLGFPYIGKQVIIANLSGSENLIDF